MYDLYVLVLGLGLAVTFFFSAFAIALYVLKSLGLYTMAKNRNIENAWLAWIPIADMHIIGKLIGPFNIASINLENPEVILPIAAAVVLVCGGIPIIGWLIAVAYMILYFFAVYNLFVKYDESRSVLYIILSIILHIEGILYFIMRNNDYTDDVNIL